MPVFSRKIWRLKPLLAAATAIAIVLTLIFGIKAFLHYTYWDEHRLRPIVSWMTPNYIARKWDIDRDDIFEALSIIDENKGNVPLIRLANEKQQSPLELIGKLQDLIEDEHGEPPA